jgi:hypothetical protein
MPEIFISYRREDAVAHAGRLSIAWPPISERNTSSMDIDTIKPGEDYVEVLEKTVGSCDVLIALIGKQWLGALDESGQSRLENSEDFLRRELSVS